VAVASAGTYASLHHAPDRQPRQDPNIQFLQAGCPSCHPIDSIKALKARLLNGNGDVNGSSLAMNAQTKLVGLLWWSVLSLYLANEVNEHVKILLTVTNIISICRMDATLLKESSDTSRPSMVSEIVCWSDSSRSSNPRMSSGSVMIFVVGLARTNVSKMHLTWWYWRISPPVLLYGFITTCNIYVYIYI